MSNATNWESILKWSLLQSDGTQTTRQISEEERKWFSEAVANNQIDIVKRMKEISTVMQIPEGQLQEQGVTVEEIEGMLEELNEHVESIDMANDLGAIGGLVPLLNYLNSSSPGVRAKAAEVVTTVVQNNPKSQRSVMDAGGLPLLFTNFTSDTDMTVRVKALGAISSLIRNYGPATEAFRIGGGLRSLKDALSTDNVRLLRKSLYVLQYVLEENPTDCKSAVDIGFGPILIQLAESSDLDVRLAALQVLLTVSSFSPQESKTLFAQKVDDADSSSVSLKKALQTRMNRLQVLEGKDLEDLLEERSLISRIWGQCLNSERNVSGNSSGIQQETSLNLEANGGGNRAPLAGQVSRVPENSIMLLGGPS